MADTIVEHGYSVLLPEEVRPHVAVGQRYAVTVGAMGELVLTPVDQQPMADLIDAILERTAGLWRDREDIPCDGTEYVNQFRQGRRLDDLTDLRHDH